MVTVGPACDAVVKLAHTDVSRMQMLKLLHPSELWKRDAIGEVLLLKLAIAFMLKTLSVNQ